MNWEAIGAIGEIVGAVAVVITLAFLVVQVRHNNAALLQQSTRESTANLQRVCLAYTDPAVAAVISKVYGEGDPELTVAEMAVIDGYANAFLTSLQQDYLDIEKGLLDAQLWEARRPVLEGLLMSKFLRIWWRERGRQYFVAGFREMVDAIVRGDPLAGGEYWAPVIAAGEPPDDHRAGPIA